VPPRFARGRAAAGFAGAPSRLWRDRPFGAPSASLTQGGGAAGAAALETDTNDDPAFGIGHSSHFSQNRLFCHFDKADSRPTFCYFCPMANTFKTFLLLAALTVLLVFLGRLIGGPAGMTIALGMAAVMNLMAYLFGHKVILWQYRAVPLPEGQYRWIYDMTQRLCQRSGLPMPKLYLIPSPQPNAFATGPSPAKGIVAFTAGILQAMDKHEIEGVLAHELAHIKNRDMLTMTIAATVVGAITWIVDMLRWSAIFGSMRSRDNENSSGLELVFVIVVGIIASIAAVLIQLAISRTREYAADAEAARMAGTPDGLISALKKLETYTAAIPMEQATPATSHLFIANPFKGAGDWIASLFSTHPPIPKRIAKLQSIKYSLR